MNTAKEVCQDTESKMKKTMESVHREFNTVRTGRASSALVEGIMVSYYETDVPLKQLANIGTPDPRQIVIQPWDPGAIGDIEKAVLASDIGITPNNDGKVIRLTIPPLTDERREELIRLVKKMTETGRISLRSARHVANEAIDRLEKEKKITEDEKFKGHKDIQNLIDKYTKEIDKLEKDKETEIHAV